MFVKAMHPRHGHQLWEVPAGQTLRYGVITPLMGETDGNAPNWAALLHANDVPGMEVFVHGDPDVYVDHPLPAGATYTASPGFTLEAPARYFIKYASWWNAARQVDVTVITGTEGDIYVMSDTGKTIEKVG